MKFRNLRYWSDTAGSEGLIFFAQLLEELLFDYSLDTYKPSAMNSSSLCIEARRLIDDIEDELIDKSNLDHILKELIDNLRKDDVAKSLLTIKIDSIARKFENKDTPIQEISVLLDIIYSRIPLQIYKERTEELLMQAVADPKEKNLIRSLARSYVTTLINIGYSTRILYPAARMYFYNNKERITGPESLEGFFKIVAGTEQKYTVIFKVSTLFNEIKDSCKVLGIEVLSKLSDELVMYAEKKSFLLDAQESYLVVSDIEAVDVFSARDTAEIAINRISTLSSFFHHKESAHWNTNALIINRDTAKERIASASQNPMLMCADSKKENAAVKLNSFINNVSLNRDSFSRLNRALELHALALRSDSPNNQLLNLWVALETLVPSKLGRNKAKINNIIDSTLPFLSITYIETLTTKLTHDFCLWNRPIFYKSLDGITGGTIREQLIKLLVLPEYVENKNQLFKELDQFYLLRNRANYFANILSDPSKIRSLLENHSQRVDWQIRRIYRTRNLIVHAGHTPPYINVLIKNIHDYLDIIINTISLLASDGEKINSIDVAFKHVEIAHSEYLQDLKEATKTTTAENINRIIIMNPL
jgi:hypothetical protein